MDPMKILVSEHPDFVLRQINKIVNENGWHIESASSVDQVHSVLLSDRSIRIAVIDRHAGGENFSLISEVKQINPFIRIILIVEEWNLEEIRSAMNKGAFDILLCPVDYPSLSATIIRAAGQVIASMRANQTDEKLRLIQKELEVSSRIQQLILPSPSSEIECCDVSASMIPAREIGGDFYDYFMINKTQIGFVIGDVSGKGIPAALFMAVCRTLTKATALQGWSPHKCLIHVNRVLSEDNPSAMFVTMFYGILDVPERKLEYCIGGHDSPLLIKTDGKVMPLERTANMALGFDGEVSYLSKTIYLNKGENLFLFTDGITEAESPTQKLFGRDRLIESLQSLSGKTAEQLIEGALRKIRSFTMGTIQSDDITAMAVTI
jgi:sigma-B regulation protein RsbU (phosphoserine phosphatase)